VLNSNWHINIFPPSCRDDIAGLTEAKRLLEKAVVIPLRHYQQSKAMGKGGRDAEYVMYRKQLI